MTSIRILIRNPIQGWRAALAGSTALVAFSCMGAHAQDSRIIVGPGETQTIAGQAINASGNQSVYGIRLNGPGSSFTGSDLTINVESTTSSFGSPSAGLTNWGGTSSTTGSVYSLSGTHTYGLHANGNATREITMTSTNDSITTEGDFGFGVFAYSAAAGGSSAVIINGSSITTHGDNAYGLLAQGANTSITANGLSVATNGTSAMGAYTYGGSVELFDSGIITRGERGYGAYAAFGGKVAFTGGTIDTDGSRGYGLYSTGAGSEITANDVAISTTDAWTFGAYATDEGTITLGGGSITTKGERAFGILASTGGTVTSSANVITTGARAHGVRSGENAADDSGTVNLTGGTVSTGGDDAFGLHALASGTISATGDVIVSTTGANGFGAFAESDSSISLEGTTIRTTGANGFGLLVNNDKNTTGGQIAASSIDVLATGAGAQAARIEKGGEMTISSSRLESQNAAGIALVDNATVTLIHTEITSSQETISSTFHGRGQTQTINIGDGTVATVNNGTLLNVTRFGDGSTGVMNLNLGAGSTTHGDIVDEGTKTSGGTDVVLEEGAAWTGLLRGIRNFFGYEGGEVSFQGEADIAGSLTGNGTSYIFSDQGANIGGNVSLNNSSRTTGGTIENRINVAGDVAVDETSTLGGNWNIGGDLSSAGMLTPGNSVGRVSVGGDLVLTPTSIYEIDVNAAGDADLIKVVGTANLAGSVAVAPLDGFLLGSQYTILTAGTLTGTFEEDVDFAQETAFLDAFLSYDPTTVFLTIERNDVDFTSVAETINQAAVAGTIDKLPLTSPLASAIAFGSAQVAKVAFDQVSGEIHASAKTALMEDSHHVRQAANERLRSAFGNATAPSLVMAYGPDKAPGRAVDATLQPAADFGPAAWGTAFGSWGSNNGNGNAAELDRSTSGVLAGVDGMFGTWRIGALAGYSHSSFDVGARTSSGSADNFHLGLYGGTHWGALGFRSGLAYTWSDIQTQRSVSFVGFSDSLSANYNAGTFQAFGELGYSMEAATTSFEPFINLAHVNLQTDGFTGTGGAATLSSARSSTDTTFTTLGLRASTDFAIGDITATTRGMAGWRHAFGDTTPLATHAFAGGDAFTVAGTPIARNAAVIEAGLDFDISPAATLGVSYSGQLGSGSSEHGGRIGLDVKF